MRRLRLLLTFASSISLALALATTALWARSFRWSDSVHIGWPAPRPWMLSSRGGRFVVQAGVPYESGNIGWWWRSYREYDNGPWEEFIPGVAARKLGWGDFRYVKGSYLLARGPMAGPARGRFRMIVFQGWLPPIVLGLLPAWWFPRVRRAYRARRRSAAGLCMQCAYDLRGNPTGVCPECGTLAVTASTA